MRARHCQRDRVDEADGGQTRHEVDQALESLRKRNEELLKVKEEKKDDPSPVGPAEPDRDEMEDVLEETPEPPTGDDWASWWSWSDSDWSWWQSNRGSRWRDDQWRGHREEWHHGGGRGRGGGGGWNRGKGRGRHHGGRPEGHGGYTTDGRFVDSWGNVQPLLDFISLDFLFVTLSHSLALHHHPAGPIT